MCGGCSRSFHAAYIDLTEVPRGPYYCADCLAEYESRGIVDITLDRPLMAYLYDGIIPTSPAELEMCARTSRWLKVDLMGDLVMTQVDGRQRVVPLIGE